MSRTPTSSLKLLAAATGMCASTLSFANSAPRQMLHPDFETISLQSDQTQHHLQAISTQVQLSPQQLSQLRAQGVDINLTKSNNDLPDLAMSPDNFTPSAAPGSIDHILNTKSDNTLPFSFERNTALNDGNIAGSTPSLPGTNPDSIATMTQSEGSYNFYEMAYEWEAASTKRIDFSLISGITAIEASVAKRVQSGGSSNIYDVTRRVITVPTIGSAVRWNISERFSFKGEATTQSINLGSSLLEFNAQTDWRINDRVGLSAGYQILRSEFDLGAVTTDLNQEGLFARLQIKF